MTIPGTGVYAGSKAAVEAMVRVVAMELGGRGVTVAPSAAYVVVGPP